MRFFSLTLTLCFLVTDSFRGLPWTADFAAPLTDEWSVEEAEGDGQEYARYNADPAVTSFEREGTLVLSVRPTSGGKLPYAAPRLISRRAFGLGTWRVVAQLPKETGLAPAISLQPAAGTPCPYPDDGGRCTDSLQGDVEILRTANTPQEFPYLLRSVRLGRSMEGTNDPAVWSGPDSPERVSASFWAVGHAFELVRNTSGLYWFVDSRLKQRLTVDDAEEFVSRAGNASDGATPPLALLLLDPTLKMNLVLRLGVGGAVACASCNGCCPVLRTELIANTTINHKPYVEMVVEAVHFTPEDPLPELGAHTARAGHLRLTFALVGSALIGVALWGFTVLGGGRRKPDPDQRNAEVWLFQKHSDALIYGTSFREGAYNQSFSNYSQLGTSPYTSSIGTSVSDGVQMGQSPSVFRWGPAPGMGHHLGA
eukprot:EG_transcript_10401